MAVWRVVLLLNLALAVGVGWGYVFWGRRAERLGRELTQARAAAALTGEREYHVTGVVRAVLADISVVVITHDEIPGYMPSMTMGFRSASPKIHDAIRAGDAVRFTLKGTLPNLAITAIEPARPGTGGEAR